MTPGLTARLGRVGTAGRHLVVPMDHGITLGPVAGLVELEATVAAICANGADAVLTHTGVAGRVLPQTHGAGFIVHLNGSTAIGPDEDDKRQTASVPAAIRAGADAVSFHMNVGSPYEPDQMTQLSAVIEEAHRFGLPVLAMSYARGPGIDETDPTALAHAVRLAAELGADLIKTGYSGDPESYREVTAATHRPVLIAGGARGSDTETLEMVAGAMDAGAAGVSMGRSIFQHPDPGAITAAVAAVIHEGADPAAAAAEAGL